MLHSFQQTGPDLADPVLREMFDARRRVFVDLLKWDVRVTPDGFEIDGYDDVHATYLVVSDVAGAHLASARLLPTTRPHLLDSLFQDLCEGPVPTGAAVFEVTRFCLERRIPTALRRGARDVLVQHLATFAVHRGIAAFTGVAEIGWLQQILAFGWRCRPLGMPRSIGGRMLGAFQIDLDAATPALLATNGIRGDTLAEEDLRHAA